MKVSELEGAELDYWVGMAHGEFNRKDTNTWPLKRTDLGYVLKAHVIDQNGKGISCREYKPSSDWSRGGPIIQREKIGTYSKYSNYWKDTEWVAGVKFNPTASAVEFYKGPTPLIAAMRAFVAAKYGEEVPSLNQKKPG